MTLATLTAADFAPRKGEAFTLSGPAGAMEITLTNVHELGASLRERKAFSVHFLGPAQPIMPQSIYRLENPAMGPLDIFLVPLGPRDGGMRYEAVFT
jgi:hypothetical protein